MLTAKEARRLARELDVVGNVRTVICIRLQRAAGGGIVLTGEAQAVHKGSERSGAGDHFVQAFDQVVVLGQGRALGEGGSSVGAACVHCHRVFALIWLVSTVNTDHCFVSAGLIVPCCFRCCCFGGGLCVDIVFCCICLFVCLFVCTREFVCVCV